MAGVSAHARLLETCKEEQESEREVIQSIYEKEAEFAKNSWKIWRPIDVTLKLQPVESGSRIGAKSAPTVTADLHVACTDRYPVDAPRVELLNIRGIPSNLQETLKEAVQTRVKEMKGQQMILDLAELVRNFLADHRVAPTGSCHQGMMEKKRMEENEMRRKTETILERQKEEIESERERREEEKRMKREEEREEEGRKRRESEAADAGTEAPSRRIGSRKVFLLPDDAAPPRKGLHPACHEWYGVYERESILVSEWRFTHNLGAKGGQPMKEEGLRERMRLMEKEAEKMVELEEQDDSLARVAFVEVATATVTQTNVNIRIFIGQRIPKTAKNLEAVIGTLKKDEAALRRLTLQMVCGLRWLHDQSMVHGALSMSTMWQVDPRTFILSDCGVLRLVLQVADAFKECIGSAKGTAEGREREKATKKRDLFALGCLLDQFQLALRPSPESSSSSVDPLGGERNELGEFIQLCQSAKTADELLDHPFLIQDIQPTGSTVSSVPSISRASRLIKEFNVFKWLGKGGFGEVTLARNKLDGNDYAVKTIPLDPGSASLNKKVKKEAKTFSGLNHPNIVRYFAAWTEDLKPPEKTEERPKSAKKMGLSRKPSSLHEGDSLLPSRMRGIEARAVEMSEWSTSYRMNEHESDSSSSSASSSSSEEGEQQLPGRTLFSPQHESDSSYDIFFGSNEGDEDEEDEEEEMDSGSTTHDERETRDARGAKREGEKSSTGMTRNTEAPPTQMLYIQMEYCARGTLRTMIDRNEFANDPKKIWRVFGEILSGLQYIHQRDFIHRDIKPMNILLDSKWHVKIGDFGLATRLSLSKGGGKTDDTQDTPGTGSRGGGGGQQSVEMTMDIGTELYMAPELFKSGSYTNKIDVFSAGIVLFEMFHRPLPPGMERISTLRELKEGVIPADFGGGYTSNHASNARRLIEWMLAVDPETRPTVRRILQDEKISFNDSEEEVFKKQLIKTVKSRKGRLFKYVMEALVKEEPTAAQGYCYDAGILKERFNMEREWSMGVVIGQLAALLQLHSFRPLSSPLLRASMSAKAENSRTKPVLMVDQSGFPVHLPFDLRENFVRVVARNNVFRLKRYTIGRSFGYGEIPGGVHPIERWECSVDAVGPERSALTLEMSILSILVTVAANMVDSSVRCVLRLGHISLIHAALLHEGMGEEKQKDALQMMAMKKGRDLKDLMRAPMPAPTSSAEQFREDLSFLLRSRNERVREKTREAIGEIERVVEALRTADDSLLSAIEVLLDPLLVARPSVFSDGLCFQLESMQPNSKRSSILAQGGRYDHLLTQERCAHDHVFDSPMALVGCSLSLDLLVNCGGGKARPPSVLVCSFTEPLWAEKLQLTSALRKRGVIVEMLDGCVEDNEELADFCTKNGVSALLVLLSRGEVLMKRMSEGESSKLSPDAAVEQAAAAYSGYQWMMLPAATSASSDTLVVPVTPTHSKESAKPSMANVLISYGTTERMAYNTKKRVETQVKNTLADSFALFKQQTVINVVVVGVGFELVKNIAGMLTRTSVPSELTNLFDTLQKSHGKAKEDLESIYAALMPFFKEKSHNPSPLVLFRHQDNLFRFII